MANLFTLQAFAEDTLAAQMTAGATTATLTTGNFTTATNAMLVVDYDVPAKREIIKCAVDGTAITSVTRAQDGTSAVQHEIGAKVIMAFVPSHYSALTNFVGARATLSANQQNITLNTYTKVLLDTETYDVGGNFAANKFVAPVNGYYFMSGNVAWLNTETEQKFITAIYINGAVAAEGMGHTGTNQAGINTPVSDVRYLAAGNYVELYGFSTDSDGSADIAGGATNTYLTVTLLKEV